MLRPRPEGGPALWLPLVLVPLLLPGAAEGQARRIGPDAPPDSVALGFQTALRGAVWRAAADLMHPEGLESFRRLLGIITGADSTRSTLELVLPGAGPDALSGLPPEELFVRATRNLGRRLPGILHSLSAREVTVLGSVREPPDRAHVVYRNRDLLEGAVPQVRVMTLRRSEGRWRVTESEELQLLREALRGLARIRPPPSDPGPDQGG